jgi:hypothetical protein
MNGRRRNEIQSIAELSHLKLWNDRKFISLIKCFIVPGMRHSNMNNLYLQHTILISTASNLAYPDSICTALSCDFHMGIRTLKK